MLIHNVFHIDEHNHEDVPVESDGFPYVCIRTQLDRYAEKSITWHWHTAFEITYLAEGEVTLLTPDEEINLHKGDAVFINSGVLHFYRAVNNSSCVMYAQLFDMHLLTGSNNSVFEEKYCNPILHNESLQAWKVHPDEAAKVKMIDAILKGIESASDEPEGYEFDVRTYLSTFWRYLIKETEKERVALAGRNVGDVERIKKMMDYIHDHYTEKIMLEQIASSGGVSIRECTRCFRRCINSSPTDYLTQVRVRRAAELLIKTPMSILDISEACGFSSSSYFSKVFREAYRCTPNAYRNHQR